MGTASVKQDSVELRATRANLISQASEIIQRAEKDERVLSETEQTEWDGLIEHAEKINQEIQTQERKEYTEHASRELSRTATKKVAVMPTSNKEEYKRNYNDALKAWFKAGFTRNIDSRSLDAASACGIDLYSNQLRIKRDNLDGSAGKGLELNPVGFLAELQRAIETMGGVRSVARKIDTDHGNPLEIPVWNDLDNTATLVTGTNEPDKLVPDTSTVVMNAYTWASVLPVTVDQLEDSGVDLVSNINLELARRIFKGTESYFTTGTGTGQPQGVVPGSGFGSNDGTLGWDTLVSLECAVDAAYRDNAHYMMNDAIYCDLKKKTDLNGRPLLLDATESLAGKPRTILNGHPIVINNFLDSTTDNGSKPMLFGNFNAGYAVRTVRDITITRLNELGRLSRLIYFLVEYRGDGRYYSAQDVVVHWAPNSASPTP